MPGLVKARQRVLVWADTMRVEDRGNNHPRHERARMSHMEWKNDTYRQARGGYARLLAVSRATCGTHLSRTKRMGLGSSKDCIWTAFTSPTPTKASSIVNASATNAARISAGAH